mmetsp:Transcript_27640/g.108412  ORF Transcript_27640/g.108412 Transcript_27640/m.108412 type:complete len:201 (+) Transcript_27640:1639-2241(+)
MASRCTYVYREFVNRYILVEIRSYFQNFHFSVGRRRALRKFGSRVVAKKANLCKHFAELAGPFQSEAAHVHDPMSGRFLLSTTMLRTGVFLFSICTEIPPKRGKKKKTSQLGSHSHSHPTDRTYKLTCMQPPYVAIRAAPNDSAQEVSKDVAIIGSRQHRPRLSYSNTMFSSLPTKARALQPTSHLQLAAIGPRHALGHQ